MLENKEFNGKIHEMMSKAMHVQTNSDKLSEQSHKITGSIRNAMYGTFQDFKKAQPEALQEHQDVRSKAQLEALKRFIETMEVDAVEQKRIAQEQRVINAKNDIRKRKELQKRKKFALETAEYQKEQTKFLERTSEEKRKINREIPDIAGDQGYP